MLGALSTRCQHSRNVVTSCKNVLEPEQIAIEALESRFPSHDVLANLPTGFGKI